MLKMREVILFKIESTYNVDPTPTPAADAIMVRNPSWAHEGARLIDRPNVTGTLDTKRKLYGGSLQTVSFEVELKGSGAAGTPPEFGSLLRACYVDETIVASTSVTYGPISTAPESGTLYYYMDGKRKVLTGCVCDVSFNWPAGELGIATFTVTGHMVSPDTDVAVPTGTYDATEPVPLTGLSVAIGGVSTYTIQALTANLGNSVVTPPDTNASDGYGQIRVTERDVNGSINPEDELVATKDFVADWQANLEQAITTGNVGSSAGNIYNFTMPKCAFREVGQGERDGIRTVEIGFGAGITSGDDEFSLVFT